MSEQDSAQTSREIHAIIDPDHPEAGKGGVVPPLETRWKKGVSANPGGKLKGSFSTRAAWKRKLAKGYETDTEAGEGEEKIGILARELADRLYDAIVEGNDAKVRAIAAAIAEAEGKPQERVEHSGGQTLVQIVGVEVPDEAPDEAQEPR